MAKRPAELSLEEVSAMNSPASKKARVEDVDMEPTTSSRYTEINHREQDERRGDDILAAADQEGEELEEAAADRPGYPDVDDEVSALSPAKRQTEPLEGYNDLYLDTINRAVLDFDFEKLCSISLSNINVYACLVCGRYFQGRGPKSYAYFHALEVGHHVYVNLETKKVYVLPEGYEVKNKSLDDIKYVVDPQYTKEEVGKLDKETKDSWDLMGKKYRPGIYSIQHCLFICRRVILTFVI